MPSAAQDRGVQPVEVPIPRRGRFWIVLALGLAVIVLGYAIVGIATKEAGREVVRLAGVSDAQGIFAGIPQEGDRLGSSNAPVSIQVFNDLQCGNCSEDFLGTIPALARGPVRDGDVKLLYRHYSVSPRTQELGFYGAEAAAQQGYGWQYTYLFFRNQGEAERFGIDQNFLDSLAGGVGELDEAEWLSYLEDEGGSDGAISRQLESYEELGASLGIRTRQAAIVNGPRGTRTLQDGPSLPQIEAAIAAVR